MYNISGGKCPGVNVLPKMGGGIVRGYLSYTRPFGFALLFQSLTFHTAQNVFCLILETIKTLGYGYSYDIYLWLPLEVRVLKPNTIEPKRHVIAEGYKFVM